MIKVIALNFMNMAHSSPTYYHITERQAGLVDHHRMIPEKQTKINIFLKSHLSEEFTQVF